MGARGSSRTRLRAIDITGQGLRARFGIGFDSLGDGLSPKKPDWRHRFAGSFLAAQATVLLREPAGRCSSPMIVRIAGLLAGAARSRWYPHLAASGPQAMARLCALQSPVHRERSLPSARSGVVSAASVVRVGHFIRRCGQARLPTLLVGFRRHNALSSHEKG